MFEGFLSESIVARACRKGACEIFIRNLRDYSHDRHRRVDDRPYGGGPGMLMKCEPWFEAVESVTRDQNPDPRSPLALRSLGEGGSPEPRAPNPETRIIMTSPAGRRFTQHDAEELSRCGHVVFMCGHYEGFDERIRTLATDEFSIGDFVMTGGELAAAAMTDAIVRLLPGVLGGGLAATRSESFSSGMLEAPQWTHPAEFRGMKVPEVLLSGDHAKAEAWRKSAARRLTEERRPDLLK